MEVKTVSSTELRIKARDIIESARYEGQHFVVETFGKPMVAIIGINEYRTLMEQGQTRSTTERYGSNCEKKI